MISPFLFSPFSTASHSTCLICVFELQYCLYIIHYIILAIIVDHYFSYSIICNLITDCMRGGAFAYSLGHVYVFVYTLATQ